MFDSQYDNTPLLSRQFITTTHRSRFQFCTPRVFIRSLRGCIAEFVATTILMFVSAMIMHNISDKPSELALMVAIGNGFLYAALISITMHISAGFLNPAVTVAVALAGVLNPITAMCYILMQILGAVAGAGIVSLYSEGTINSAVQHLRHLPGRQNINGTTVILAIFYEFLTTSLLVLVVLICAIDKTSKLKNIAPIVLGFSVTVGIFATYDFTGGSLNPARSFGPAAIGTSDNRWDYHYVYWVGPLAGGVISSVVYRLFFAAKSWIPLFRQRDDDDDDDEVVTVIN